MLGSFTGRDEQEMHAGGHGGGADSRPGSGFDSRPGGGLGGFAAGFGRWLTIRRLQVGWWAVFVLTLVPIAFIARHDLPSADDFGYTAASHAAFLQTGSVLAAIRAAAATAVQIWHEWQGTFASVFLMALQPGVFNDSLYAITPLIMVGTLFAGVFGLCRTVLCRVFGADKASANICALFVMLFAVQCAPSAIEGFFWFNGAVFYTFSFGLSALMFSLLISFSLADSPAASAAAKPRRRAAQPARLLACFLLAVFVGGGNYVTALGSLLLYLLLFFLLILQKNKQWKWIILPFFVFALCFALSALAPGNAVRSAGFADTPSAAKTVVLALLNAPALAAGWMTLPLAVGLCLLGPVLWRMAVRSAFAFRFPLLVSLVSWGFLAANLCPTLYAMGSIGDGRTVNLYYYTFLLLLVFNLFYWFGWVAGKTRAFCLVPGAGAGAAPQKTTFPQAALGWMRRHALSGISGLAAAFLLVVIMVGAQQDLTSYIALRSVASGEAAAYSAQMRQRVALLEDPAEKEVYLPALTVRPRLLFYVELGADPEYWSNKRIATYYGKDKVYLLPAEETVESTDE